jgi:hypothetical protein
LSQWVTVLRLRSRLGLMWRNSLFVEYRTSIASDFDDDNQCFEETKLILLLRGYMGSASLKTTPSRASQVRKREWSLRK